MPESTSRAPSCTTGTPTRDPYAEAIAREREQCRRMDDAIAEFVAAAGPPCGTADDLQVDHKVPVALGGKNDLDNLHFLCRPCNNTKGTMTWAAFLTDLMVGD